MADESNDAAQAADPIPQAAAPEPTPGAPTVTHEVVRPIGEEFPITDHESIAAKLKAEFEHIEFVVETDVKNGVHKLVGWVKAHV